MKRLIYILLLGVIMTSSFVQVGHARSAGFPSKLELKVGETKTVTVEYEGYTDHSFAPTTNGVIDVNISGRTAYVTGLRTGTAYIAVNVWRWYIGSTERDIVHFLCEVTVTEPDPANISLSAESLDMCLLGEREVQLSASVLPDGAPQGVSWSVVSGSNVAYVSPLGIVTAKALGTATVRATSTVKSSVYKDCIVTVRNTFQDGDVFSEPTEEGINMTYKIISVDGKTCQVGKGVDHVEGGTTYFWRSIPYSAAGSVTIPSEVRGFKVIGINDGAFINLTGITSINIPNTIESIGRYAFQGCSKLESLHIPNSVKEIGIYAASMCTKLSELVLPEEINAIPASLCWKDSVLTSIDIPASVRSIGASAFKDCVSLRFITSLIEEPFFINSSVFDEIVNEKSILYVPYGTKEKYMSTKWWNSFKNIIDTSPNKHIQFADTKVKAICIANWDKDDDGELSEKEAAIVTSLESVFKYNEEITSFNELRFFIGLTSIDNDAFYGCSSLTSVTIPEGVTSIGGSAFYGCSGLTSVTIPESVTSIGDYAFRGCSGLTSVTIPNSVTSIGNYTFSRCSGLTSVYCYAENVPTTDSSAFNNSPIASATLHVPAGSVEAYKTTEPWSGFGTIVVNIPFADAKVKALCVANWDNNNDGEFDTEEAAAVTNLKEVFRGNKEIKSFDELQFFTGLKNIDKNAFYLCSSLTSIAIPESVTSIDGFAFYGCSGLTSVTIPESVTSIDYGAFWGCRSLTAITIPNGVTRIGNFAFLNCVGLTSITIPESVTSIGVGIFESCDGLTSIVVESENAVYDSRDNCNAIIELSTNRLIAGCKNTNIPGSVTTIGRYAFSVCSGLTSITIPNSVTSIDDFAFWECDGLTSITIPESVTRIGIQSFRYCRSLKSVTIGNGVTSIGICAFGECKNLTSLNIPSSVTSIDDSAFYGCSCLTSVTIPTSVFSIGKNPFYDCKGITSFNVEQGNIHYDSRDNCNAIIETSSNTLISGCRNTNIPKSVTSIGDDAFYGCSGLTSVTIPNSVTTIGKYAFQGCGNLTSVLTNREQPIPIQSGHFSNRENATLYVPHGSSAAYKAAEIWCEFKEIVDCMEGDVNLDENTDVVDVVDIARFVVGMPSDSFVEIFADINKDGSVNLADAVAVVNSIVGEQNFVKPLVAPEGIDRDDDLTLVEGGGCLSLSLGNTRYYTAFQFDLHLPQGVDLDVIALNAKRKQGHQLLYNKVEDGHYRVAALSTNNSAFVGNEGELLNIVLAGVPEDKVNIRNIHFFDADGNDYLFDDLESTVATSLNCPVPSDQKGEIYDLYGRKHTTLQHGINISGGKKILVR